MAGNKGDVNIDILSNDGTTVLKENQGADFFTASSLTLNVTDSGLIWSHKDTYYYSYSGSNKFIGVATSANSTEPTYAVGESIVFTKQTNINLYIVEEEKPKPTKTFDLSTLNLSAGTHEITVKARASGYADSEPSNAVSYTVETYTVSGTWYFNIDITTKAFEQMVSFTSDGVLYNRMSMTSSNGDLYYDTMCVHSEEPLHPEQTSDWYNEAFRTITFDGVHQVSKVFYEWLTANAARLA